MAVAFISIITGLMIFYKSQSVKMQEAKEINVIKQQQVKEKAVLELEAQQRKQERDATPKAYNDCVEAYRFQYLDKKVAIGLMSPGYATRAKSYIIETDPATSLKAESEYQLTQGICKDLPIKTDKACQEVVAQADKPLRAAYEQQWHACAEKYIK